MPVLAHDRRPKLADSVRDEQVRVRGMRCVSCDYPIVQPVPRCPECHGEMVQTSFEPTGIVVGATCIRVRVPGHHPPFAIAHLDLDQGPRVLVHTGAETILRPGARARITGIDDKGDLVAKEVV